MYRVLRHGVSLLSLFLPYDGPVLTISGSAGEILPRLVQEVRKKMGLPPSEGVTNSAESSSRM